MRQLTNLLVTCPDSNYACGLFLPSGFNFIGAQQLSRWRRAADQMTPPLASPSSQTFHEAK
jgi:hypothetical protein